ncbi:MAG: NUDIX domain-containing protein [Clostridiales bacterium]|nr:NUDIX domain-containing protein [Clostridiales bacterium]
MEKRESCRAIIFKDEKMVAMYREKNGRTYYTFPGGGMDEGETINECVKREVIEEFGIVVKPIREVYTYEDEKTYQHFILCDWEFGELGTGEGEEFQGDASRGVYEPMLIDIENIPNLPLMPPEAAMQVVDDYKSYGKNLDSEVKSLTSIF